MLLKGGELGFYLIEVFFADFFFEFLFVDGCDIPFFFCSFAVELDFEADVLEGVADEVADGGGDAGGDDVVVGLVLLEDEVHGFDVVFGVTPVAPGGEVAEVELILQAQGNLGNSAGDFAGDEGFATDG